MHQQRCVKQVREGVQRWEYLPYAIHDATVRLLAGAFVERLQSRLHH